MEQPGGQYASISRRELAVGGTCCLIDSCAITSTLDASATLIDYGTSRFEVLLAYSSAIVPCKVAVGLFKGEKSPSRVYKTASSGSGPFLLGNTSLWIHPSPSGYESCSTLEQHPRDHLSSFVEVDPEGEDFYPISLGMYPS